MRFCQTFRSEDKLWIVMELLSGGELYKHLKKYGRFTQPMVKFYSAEIALAIEYLHKKSLVYRDLKPENVPVYLHLPPFTSICLYLPPLYLYLPAFYLVRRS